MTSQHSENPELCSPQPPALLVSLHDVSPLTLERSQRAYEHLESLGVPAESMTVLVIANHENVAPLDEHPSTVAWLQEIEARGANLVMHGFTHRMPTGMYKVWDLQGLAWAQGFARGQGEFYGASAAQYATAIQAAAAVLKRAGLHNATTAFVPPAWLLSKAAKQVVKSAGFHFYETMRGIVCGEHTYAKRLIGWGSLNRFESHATSLWASWLSRRQPSDTRLCVHPADVDCARSWSSVQLVLSRLLKHHRCLNYQSYLKLKRP